MHLKLRVASSEAPTARRYALSGRRPKNAREGSEYALAGTHSFALRTSGRSFG
jgi:hypothetical protein